MDRLRHILKGGKSVIAEMEAKEKEATGIRTLKIGYNKVFGYYIEVSNSFKDQVRMSFCSSSFRLGGGWWRFFSSNRRSISSVAKKSDRAAGVASL